MRTHGHRSTSVVRVSPSAWGGGAEGGGWYFETEQTKAVLDAMLQEHVLGESDAAGEEGARSIARCTTLQLPCTAPTPIPPSPDPAAIALCVLLQAVTWPSWAARAAASPC